MGPDKPKKSCFNCTKRRIICDLAEPTCKKCERKGLQCPGYGIRYRFSGGQTVSPSEIRPIEGSTTIPSNSRRRRNLKWVGVSNPIKRKRVAERSNLGLGARPLSSTASKGIGGTEAAQATQAQPGEEVGRRVFSDDQAFIEADLGVAHSEISDVLVQGSADSNEPWISPDDSSVIGIKRNDYFSEPTMILSLPPLLSHPNPTMRLLLDHFSIHISPVMLMYDDEANGYGYQILPLAHCDPTIERAVCVAAAFHLSQRMPELRLPAENGRAAIIRKLSQTSHDLTDKTWATIVLLVVADLITGHEHVIELYKMLVAFLDARGQLIEQRSMGGDSPLGEFLFNQSRIISFFAHPALAESRAISDFSHVLQDPRGRLEEPAPRRNLPLQFLIMASGEQALDRALSNARTRLYMDIVREATKIYLLRASSGNNGLPLLSAIPGLETLEGNAEPADKMFAIHVAHIRQLIGQVDPTAPGSHTIVWPAFVAAAESRNLQDREFFSKVLRRIWESTGYTNVLKGLNALPQIWEGQTRGERWTATLTGLKTVVM